MTPADTDVRTGKGRTAGSPCGAGGSVLARLRLHLLEPLRNLDQKLVLLLSASLTSACIIPVGPQWQDPAGAPNAGPEILDQKPPAADEATATDMDGYKFSITVKDDNGDKLYLKWLVESPIGSHTLRVNTNDVPAPGNGAPTQMQIQETIGCTEIGMPTQTRFRITAGVADGEIDEVGRSFVVNDPAKLRTVVWILNLTCAQSP